MIKLASKRPGVNPMNSSYTCKYKAIGVVGIVRFNKLTLVFTSILTRISRFNLKTLPVTKKRLDYMLVDLSQDWGLIRLLPVLLFIE